jgi:hypothetical protein
MYVTFVIFFSRPPLLRFTAPPRSLRKRLFPTASPTRFPTSKPTAPAAKSIQLDNFETGCDGWSNCKTSKCGKYGSILGGYGNYGAGATTQKTFTVPAAAEYAKVELDFIKIDSWDDEKATVTANGVVCGHSVFRYMRGTQQCGYNHGHYIEQKSRITCYLKPTAGAITIKVHTSINEHAWNEAWGLDNVQITTDVRSKLSGTTMFEDHFESGCDGYTPCERSTCGGLGSMIGGHGIAGAGWQTTKTYNLGGKFESVTLRFSYVKIGSWDNEVAYMSVNGQTKWTRRWMYYVGGEHCGVNHWAYREDVNTATITIANPPEKLDVKFWSSLNENAGNEAFGVSWVKVEVGKAIKDPVKLYVANNFETGCDGWSNCQTSTCGKYGSILGGYGKYGRGATTQKTFTVPNPEYAKVELDFIKIDSWDDEQATITVNGKICMQTRFMYNRGTQQCGYNHGHYIEQKSRVECLIANPGNKVTIRAYTNINEGAHNEAWGLDNVQISTGTKAEINGKTLFEDNFDDGCDGYTPCSRSTCGKYGSILAGHNIGGAGYQTNKKYLIGKGIKRAVISFGYVKIGSWDNEWAYMSVNGQTKWRRTWMYHVGTEQCGYNHHHYVEDEDKATVTVYNPTEYLDLKFWSGLNEHAGNEAFGVSFVKIQTFTF